MLDIWELAVRVRKSPPVPSGAGSKEDKGYTPPLASGVPHGCTGEPPGLLVCIWLTLKTSNHCDCHQLRHWAQYPSYICSVFTPHSSTMWVVPMSVPFLGEKTGAQGDETAGPRLPRQEGVDWELEPWCSDAELGQCSPAHPWAASLGWERAQPGVFAPFLSGRSRLRGNAGLA